jgi:hypothetical protein
VAKWAEILKIERTGYYAWLRNREASEGREAHLKKRIKEEFDESRGTYGPGCGPGCTRGTVLLCCFLLKKRLFKGDKMARQARKRSNTGIYHALLMGINHQIIFEARKIDKSFLKY